MQKSIRKMRGWVIYVLSLMAVFTACNHFFMFSIVPTQSMAGSISPGDNVISTRYGVGEKDIQRYDVLIFTPPDKPEVTYIKRVIGLPGETIDVKNGKVYADGVELDNSFTPLYNFFIKNVIQDFLMYNKFANKKIRKKVILYDRLIIQ